MYRILQSATEAALRIDTCPSRGRDDAEWCMKPFSLVNAPRTMAARSLSRLRHLGCDCLHFVTQLRANIALLPRAVCIGRKKRYTDSSSQKNLLSRTPPEEGVRAASLLTSPLDLSRSLAFLA